MTERRPAIFLDRDGTIIDDVGYIGSPNEVRFYDETVPALLSLQGRFELVIVTNQSGVGRGLVTLDQAHEVNRYVVEWLAQSGVRIAEVFMCPHHGDQGCVCHKPKPHFVHEAVRRLNLDLSRSYVIGDHPHDVDLARNAGCTGIYVLTGHGEKHRDDLQPNELVLPNIGAAAQWILSQIARHQAA